MKATPVTLMFLKIWRVIFFITGVALMIGSIAFAMPLLIGAWCGISWMGHYNAYPGGMTLYGGMFVLDRAQSNLYIMAVMLAFPLFSWAGLHFYCFAEDFVRRVYLDLKWE